jgi:hypothetical protein
MERPDVDAKADDQLTVIVPPTPPAVTPDVARVLLRLLRTAVPELHGPGGGALGA